MTENTKYGDRIPDDAWVQEEEPQEDPDRTSVKSHKIEIIYDDVPEPEDNYDRTKYKLHIWYDDEDDTPQVFHAVTYRWKGNYWRDILDLDFRDVPTPVKEEVASRLPVNSVADLETRERVIDEGGENRWKKYHMPRIEGYDSGEMMGESYLKEALERLDYAAESFEDGSKAEQLTEKVSQSLQKVVKVVDPDGGSNE